MLRRILSAHHRQAEAASAFLTSIKEGELWAIELGDGSRKDQLVIRVAKGGVRFLQEGNSLTRITTFITWNWAQKGYDVDWDGKVLTLRDVEGNLLRRMFKKRQLYKPATRAFVKALTPGSQWTWGSRGKARTRTVDKVYYNPVEDQLSVDFLEDFEVSFNNQGIGLKGDTFQVYWTPTIFDTWKKIG